MRRPHFAIIGAQKSASTYLQRVLGAHPEIFMVNEEVDVFEDPWYSEEAVHRLFSSLPDDNRKVGIKRPDLMALEECTERVGMHLQDCRFIAVLRNPVDRAVSAYFHYMRYHGIPVSDVESGMRAILNEGIAGFPIANRILSYGLYGEHLSRLFEAFGEERFLVLLHDDLVSGAETCVRRAQEFLSVSPMALCDSVSGEAQRSIYSMRRLKILRFRAPFVRRIDRGQLYFSRRPFGMVSQIVWYAFEALDRAFLSRIWPERRPELSASLRDALVSFYARDVERLEELLQLELVGRWGMERRILS